MNTSRILALVAFVGTAAVSSAQAPLFFDGFLADNAAQPARNFKGFYLWNVTDGTVDLLGNNLLGNAPIGGRFVNLGGSTGDPGRFATRLPIVFLPGVKYNISFEYASSNGQYNRASLTVGSRVFRVAAQSKSLRTYTTTVEFSRLTTASLVFQGEESRGHIAIDNVLVTPEIQFPNTP
ncbi:hypothetical protein EON81_22980 [bacterium]|nr:MAG: hypothetical protein EON81_22980 [bacterium]